MNKVVNQELWFVEWRPPINHYDTIILRSSIEISHTRKKKLIIKYTVFCTKKTPLPKAINHLFQLTPSLPIQSSSSCVSNRTVETPKFCPPSARIVPISKYSGTVWPMLNVVGYESFPFCESYTENQYSLLKQIQ